MTRVSIIIPAWNTRDDLARCLASLFHHDDPRISVVVVDDGSDPPLPDPACMHARTRLAEIPRGGTFPIPA